MTLFTIRTVQKYKETATDAPTHMWMDRNAYFTCRPKKWVVGIWVWVPQRLVWCPKQILNISIVSYSPKTVPREPVK